MEQDFIFIYDQAENVGLFEKQISFFSLSLLSTYKPFLLVMQCCCLSCSESDTDISQVVVSFEVDHAALEDGATLPYLR